ncbi:glycosyltransferase family 4 protein [Desulfosoma caldarium]|uniref:Glycosyltransferase involved in cell wall biosynthesis n=1 Tax=Desulfosoma caldarium TaxID=610254 RepID=A0A3N1UN09_9BACT|nr:glycosyltransferase family 4 protein [Desulfosoma caldarium]ROQ90779.1 glycosyltransferase involved in cell wall biosynthesis [Desulfosoma caldarium]
MNTPRLLVLTSTFPRWQQDWEPRFVYDLCRRLAETFEVHVVAPHARGARRHERMDGMEVHRFCYFPERLQDLAYQGGMLEKIKKKPWILMQVPFFFAAQISLVRRLTRDMPFHVLHAHWILPQGLCAVLAQMGRRRQVPILCTSHGGDLFGLRGRLFDAVRRWVLDRSAAVTVVSRAMAERIRASGLTTPCHVIPMGTDLTTLFSPDPNTPRRKAVILFVGRLVEKKGVRYLLDAFGHVRQEIPDAELWIVGSGPEEAFLKSYAASIAPVRSSDSRNRPMNLLDFPATPGHITFFGPVPHRDLPAFYRTATLTVVPSVVARSGDQEGLGLVLVEAMGCGCPVIASDLPAIRDVIRPGETGLLVSPGNTLALAEAISNFLNNPELMKALSTKGRHRASAHFDWNHVKEQYTRLFTEVIGEFSIISWENSENRGR